MCLRSGYLFYVYSNLLYKMGITTFWTYHMVSEFGSGVQWDPIQYTDPDKLQNLLRFNQINFLQD